MDSKARVTLVTVPLDLTNFPEGSFIFRDQTVRAFSKFTEDRSCGVLAYRTHECGDKLVRHNEVIDSYEYYLTLLVDILNEYHSLSYSRRYWQIIVGPWLLHFLRVCRNRVDFFLEFGSFFDAVSGDVNPKSVLNSEMPLDYWDFCNDWNCDRWNFYVFTHIGSKYFGKTISVFPAPKKGGTWDHRASRPGFIKYIAAQISNRFATRNVAFLHNSWLSKRDLIRTYLAFHDIPAYYFTDHRYQRSPRDIQQREEIRGRLPLNNIYERVVADLLPCSLPMAYAENFNHILSAVARQGWPNNPQFILSANSQQGDEIFKVYVAEMVEKFNTKAVYLQHGGVYGTSLLQSEPEYNELGTSDLFFSWGWTYPHVANKVEQLGYTKSLQLLSRPLHKGEKKLNLLIVSFGGDNYDRDPWFSESDLLDYKARLEYIVDNLDKNKFEITVRLHAAASPRRSRWIVENIINRRDIVIDDGNDPISKSVSKAHICIATYNSTFYLEMFNSRQPVICTWRSERSTYQNEFRNRLEGLESDQVYFKSIEDLSFYLNNTDPSTLYKNASNYTSPNINKFIDYYVATPRISLTRTIRNRLFQRVKDS